MAKGNSKMSKGGGGGFAAQAARNVKGISGYSVVRSDGQKLDFYFRVNDSGETWYANSLSDMFEPTPNGWNESEMINTIKRFGGQVTKYTHNQLVSQETQLLKDRQQTNEILNQSYARNRVGDQVNKAYRNSRKAARMARRS